ALPNDLRLDTQSTAYQTGRITPPQLIQANRQKAERLNTDYHAFIHLHGTDELEPNLTALEYRDAQSLTLYGVPFAIKDNI
ncbi:allophanate hydrolase, partial [Pseudomonas syringae pv. tagetis]